MGWLKVNFSFRNNRYHKRFKLYMWRAEIKIIKSNCQWSIVVGIILTYFIITHQIKLLHRRNKPFILKIKNQTKPNCSFILEKNARHHLRNVENSVLNTTRKFLKVKNTLIRTVLLLKSIQIISLLFCYITISFCDRSVRKLLY